MFENLMIFQTAGKLAAYAGRRQALLSQNVANADTPGYKALDLPDFAEALRQSGSADPAVAMRATRRSHLQGVSASTAQAAPFERADEADPNGNTVALDRELMYAVEARRQHDRALAVYKSALDILRTAIQVR